jgi:hypothetical protein
MAIENYVLNLDEQFGIEHVVADPWQAELMCQRLEADTGHKRRNSLRRYGSQPWVKALPPTATNLRTQATLCLECFRDRRLRLYDCPELRYDLERLHVEEKAGSFRLSSPHDAAGHGDAFSAFSLALVSCHEIAGKKRAVASPFLGWVDSPVALTGQGHRPAPKTRTEMIAEAEPSELQTQLLRMSKRRF